MKYSAGQGGGDAEIRRKAVLLLDYFDDLQVGMGGIRVQRLPECRKLLEKVLGAQAKGGDNTLQPAAPFKFPIEIEYPLLAPAYKEVIKSPMDLGTTKGRGAKRPALCMPYCVV